MSASVKDMTKGNIMRLLVTFSAPMLMGNIFQQFYNMVDSIIVGNFVGAYALGAVGACGAVNYMFFSLCSGMAVGVGILMSQYFGAGRPEMVKKTIVNGFFVMLIMGLIMSILAFALARPLLVLMRTPAEYIEDAIRYLRIVSAGTIAVAGYNMIAAMLQALGDSKTPLLFLILSSVLNVGLDLLFVLVLQWGVSGVAIATIIAQAISAVLCVIYAIRTNSYFKLTRKYFRLDQDIMVRCLKQGLPIGLQNAMISVSTVFLQGIANSFGANVATAYTMTGRIEQLIHQPYASLAAGMSTFTGQNMGAGKPDRVKKALRISLILCGIFSVAMMLIMQFEGASVMRLFGDDQKVIGIAAKAIRITSCFYFLLGVIYVVRAICNGAGDALYPMINGVIEVFGRIFFALLLIQIPGIRGWSVWLTAGLTWALTAVVSVIRYRQGKWIHFVQGQDRAKR